MSAAVLDVVDSEKPLFKIDQDSKVWEAMGVNFV